MNARENVSPLRSGRIINGGGLMDTLPFLKGVLDCMNESVYVRDLDKNILYINRAGEKLTGWTL